MEVNHMAADAGLEELYSAQPGPMLQQETKTDILSAGLTVVNQDGQEKAQADNEINGETTGNKAEAPAKDSRQWFVMRDLKRPNAKMPAYKLLSENGFEVFVPMEWRLAGKASAKQRVERPVIPDLLFVHSAKEDLDPIVTKTDTLQYRFLRNQNRAPMTVPDKEMEMFIRAVNSSKSPKYYSPDEISPAMHGKKIRINGSVLDGFEGRLLTVRGSKTKRLLVEIPGCLAVSVEVCPEYIQLI